MPNSVFSRAWPWAAAITAAVLASYANARHGVFLFDDIRVINDLETPGGTFNDPTRPVVTITLVLDYFLFGHNPAGYHALNIFVHCAASLLLFGIVRRSLLMPRFKEQFEGNAECVAFGAALIWAVHPLQTESVTYIIQRAESMMGMFYLLALYCLIRGAEAHWQQTAAAGATPGLHWQQTAAASATHGINKWHAAALAAALLGAGTKQVIATLPFVALLYDRCFISGSFKAAWKRAPRLYLGFCLTWIVIAVLIKISPPLSAAGFRMSKVTPESYARSQFGVILQYLKLAFYPVELCFHYFWPIEKTWAGAAPNMAVIGALLGVTGWQLARNTQAGFWGAWFFIILAPTSTVMPINDLMVEHRLYLSLAGLCVLTTLGLFQLARWLRANPRFVVLAPLLHVALMFSLLTYQRNNVYASNLGMWKDVLGKRPRDPFARVIVGTDALERGDLWLARAHIEFAASVQSDHETLSKLGQVELAEKNFVRAEATFRKALEYNPKHVPSWWGLSRALKGRDMREESLNALAKAAELALSDPEIVSEFGRELFARRRYSEAEQAFTLALQHAPESAELYYSLGGAVASMGRIPDALSAFDAALKNNPWHAGAHYGRGSALELLGRKAEAVVSFRAALYVDPNHAAAANALAWILATSADDEMRNGPEALAWAMKAVELTADAPNNVLMRDTLSAAYAEVGDFEKAAKEIKPLLPRVQGSPLARELQGHLKLYEGKRAVRVK